MFELYFVLRNLWNEVSEHIPPEKLSTLKLSDYLRWFEPFVLHWIFLSKKSSAMWISNSIEIDSWQPVREGDLYSTSVLDVFRALFEILDFWNKIQWPDRDTAEEHFFPPLAQCVCNCVKWYAENVRKKIELSLESVDSDADFYITDLICVGLNNLEEASMLRARQAHA